MLLIDYMPLTSDEELQINIMHKYRTHNCRELNAHNIGDTVKISGWLNAKRDHGELVFLDIRDHYGVTQAVIDSSKTKDIHLYSKVKLESVVTITGQVVARSKETINSSLTTGEIEVSIVEFKIESSAKQIPFQVADENLSFPEDLRMKYRFLDLRRKKIHDNIVLRSKVISFLREQMSKEDFLEIQTPILTASSPEGARDFLVPSRLNPGKFYALPQAPQQFKQILMTSGFDRYFQVAPCFRDEDARADRSPGEFYQLDMEMAFATKEDVFRTIEPVLTNCFKQFSSKKIIANGDGSFPEITYHDSMLYYGSDKPDLRNPIKLADVTEYFRDSGFGIFANNIKQGKKVRAIPAPKTSTKARRFFDDFIAYAISEGAKGLAYIIFNEDGTVKSPIAKFLSEEQLGGIKESCSLENGDAVFFACDDEHDAATQAGKVRAKLGRDLELINDDEFKFCWVVDFPYYERDSETGKIDFSHNPFSMPRGGLEALENDDPLNIIAEQYDIVCNGVELSSGAIRNHLPDLMYKAFEIAGYDKSVVDDKFPAMIKAFQYGAPPHGGLAPGIDRMVMLIAGTENIREVIAFPMNGQAQDLLMNAPNYVDTNQLRDLGMALTPAVIKKMKDGDEATKS